MIESGSNSLTRRQAILACAAVVAHAARSENAAAAYDPQRGWIDAHSHIWSSDVDRWPLAAGQTRADLDPSSFTDDELMAIARPERVERVVLIQHSIYHLFDNRYLLDAVERQGERFRAVGMVDDRAEDPAAAMRRLLPRGVTGFRITPFIRKPGDEHWLAGSGMHAMWRAAAETRQAMCCLIDASELPAVDKMCAAFPDTPVVIDHFARIGVDGELRDADIAALCRLARFKHTSVKISAFYALGKNQPPHLELVPMIKRLFEAFGPKRLMWASDSPYQLQKGNTYAASISLVRDKLDFITDEDRQWLLRKAAEAVFFFR
jgi:predicted TIM-barrel fold metal-dependent hydrolase